mmetsp:Transcript_17801/g.36956  ORF Transcript_17801/g.36956 Transcript_17801/m.36956 type:complete len:126 (+) Transcript_17801:1194-1571(+)
MPWAKGKPDNTPIRTYNPAADVILDSANPKESKRKRDEGHQPDAGQVNGTNIDEEGPTKKKKKSEGDSVRRDLKSSVDDADRERSHNKRKKSREESGSEKKKDKSKRKSSERDYGEKKKRPGKDI